MKRTLFIGQGIAVLAFCALVSCAVMKQSAPGNVSATVTTNQGGEINAAVSVAQAGNGQVFTIALNNKGADQNLKSIDLTVSADKPIPTGTPYMIGADEMLRSEGNMLQTETGKATRNNDNNMYLMFKRAENDYLLVGVISWRTFLCKIYEKDGAVKIEGDGDNKLVKAGEKVMFDKVVYLQDTSWQDLLDRYADLIVKENKVPVPPSVTWTGWATWDFYVQYFVDSDVERNTKAFAALNVKPNIIQIDGGWWKQRGDYFDVRENIKGGIKGIIEKIHKDGYKAGLHFDGFRVSQGANIVKEHPEYFIHTAAGGFLTDKIDPVTKDPLVFWDYSHPGATDYIRSVMKNARENWKVDYFKIDFMRQGLYKGVSHLPVTNVERYRMGMMALKEGIGNAYFLACSPNFGVNIGIAEASRTGPDIDPNYDAVKIRAQHNSGSYYFNKKIYNCDPDYLVFRSKAESNERDGKKPSLTLEQGQMWANYVSIFGNVRLESDELPLLSADKKRLIERTMAMPFFNKCVPLDMWDHFKTDSDAPRFYLARGEDGSVCLGLFNWDAKRSNFTVSGFQQSAKLTEYNGTGIYTANSSLQLPLDGVKSVLLRYEGKETFDSLRKHLKLAANSL